MPYNVGTLQVVRLDLLRRPVIRHDTALVVTLPFSLRPWCRHSRPLSSATLAAAAHKGLRSPVSFSVVEFPPRLPCPRSREGIGHHLPRRRPRNSRTRINHVLAAYWSPLMKVSECSEFVLLFVLAGILREMANRNACGVTTGSAFKFTGVSRQAQEIEH